MQLPFFFLTHMMFKILCLHFTKSLKYSLETVRASSIFFRLVLVIKMKWKITAVAPSLDIQALDYSDLLVSCRLWQQLFFFSQWTLLFRSTLGLQNYYGDSTESSYNPYPISSNIPSYFRTGYLSEMMNQYWHYYQQKSLLIQISSYLFVCLWWEELNLGPHAY